MNDLIRILLSMTLSGTVLILLLFALKPIRRKHFSKSWQYYIWLVVILRLLIPFSYENSLINHLFHKVEVLNIRQDEKFIADTDNGDVTIQDPEYFDEMNSNATLEAEQYHETSMKPKTFDPLSGIFFALWTCVAASILIYHFVQYGRYLRSVKAECKTIDEDGIRDLFEKVKAESGVKKEIDLLQCRLITTPMLVGLFRPVIILPEHIISQVNLTNIFQHELIHLKRQDLWYKWLVQLTVSIHWFNPAVYLMRKEINLLCELSCDEAVSIKLNNSQRQEYANTLLQTVSLSLDYKNNPISTTLCEDKKNIKERLTGIMKAGKKPGRAIMLSGITAVIFILAAIVLGTFIRGSNKAIEPSSGTEAVIDELNQEENALVSIMANNWQEEPVSEQPSVEPQEDNSGQGSNAASAADEIEELLSVIMSSPKASSNPGDYIAKHPDEVQRIIDMEEAALPYLIEILDSGEIGLKGHIAKFICEDIIKYLYEVKQELNEALFKEVKVSLDEWNSMMGYDELDVLPVPMPEFPEEEVEAARAVVEEYYHAVEAKDAEAILVTLYPRENFTLERVESGNLVLYGEEIRTLLTIDYDSQDSMRRRYRPINHPITDENIIVFKVSFEIDYPDKKGGSWNEGVYDNWSMILFRDDKESPWLIYDQGY